MNTKINRKVTGLVCIALLGVVMSGSAFASAKCMGTTVSSCSSVTMANCSNMFQKEGNETVQCMASSSGKCMTGATCSE